MIDIGVARPRAQGQAMIRTATALTSPKPMAGAGPGLAGATRRRLSERQVQGLEALFALRAIAQQVDDVPTGCGHGGSNPNPVRRDRPLRRTSEAADCRSDPFRPTGRSTAKGSCDRTTGAVVRGTESLLTLRWRKMDSNHRSRSCDKVSRLLPTSSRETTMVGRGASLDGRLFLGGTDGSNPVLSSGESGELPTRLGPNLRPRFRAIDHDKGRQMAAAARQAPFCPRSSGPRWLLVAFANPREIKSECWATSSGIRGRLPSESASVRFRRQDCPMLSENAA